MGFQQSRTVVNSIESVSIDDDSGGCDEKEATEMNEISACLTDFPSETRAEFVQVTIDVEDENSPAIDEVDPFLWWCSSVEHPENDPSTAIRSVLVVSNLVLDRLEVETVEITHTILLSWYWQKPAGYCRGGECIRNGELANREQSFCRRIRNSGVCH